MNERLRIVNPLIVGLLATLIPLGGCGGASTDASGAPFAPVAQASPEVRSSAVRGRVKLDVPLAGATVTAVDSASGRALSSPAITDPSGFFEVEVPAQGAFTLEARANVKGASEVYARCYDRLPESRYLHVNAVTTLGARYRQQHPELSAQAAETRVKQALGVPGAFDAGLGAHANALSGFSHSAFVQNARAYAGGEPAYVEALVAGIDSGTSGKGTRATSAGPSSTFSLGQTALSFTHDLDDLEDLEEAVASNSALFGGDAVNFFAESASAFTDATSAQSASASKAVPRPSMRGPERPRTWLRIWPDPSCRGWPATSPARS